MVMGLGFVARLMPELVGCLLLLVLVLSRKHSVCLEGSAVEVLIETGTRAFTMPAITN